MLGLRGRVIALLTGAVRVTPKARIMIKPSIRGSNGPKVPWSKGSKNLFYAGDNSRVLKTDCRPWRKSVQKAPARAREVHFVVQIWCQFWCQFDFHFRAFCCSLVPKANLDPTSMNTALSGINEELSGTERKG